MNLAKNIFRSRRLPTWRAFCNDSTIEGGSQEVKQPTLDVQCMNIVLEAVLNDQINRELQASHDYFSMAQYFYRSSVNLFGFGAFFLHQADDEIHHARQLCRYQNLRGCKVTLLGLREPTMTNFAFQTCGVDALKLALQMEQEMGEHLKELYKMADSTNDLHAMDFIVQLLMQAQVKEIAQIQRLLAKLHNFNDNIGLYLIDKELQEGKQLLE